MVWRCPCADVLEIGITAIPHSRPIPSHDGCVNKFSNGLHDYIHMYDRVWYLFRS
jgi:hypothetical protein